MEWLTKDRIEHRAKSKGHRAKSIMLRKKAWVYWDYIMDIQMENKLSSTLGGEEGGEGDNKIMEYWNIGVME